MPPPRLPKHASVGYKIIHEVADTAAEPLMVRLVTAMAYGGDRKRTLELLEEAASRHDEAALLESIRLTTMQDTFAQAITEMYSDVIRKAAQAELNRLMYGK